MNGEKHKITCFQKRLLLPPNTQTGTQKLTFGIPKYLQRQWHLLEIRTVTLGNLVQEKMITTAQT